MASVPQVSILSAELVAILYGLKFAVQLGFVNVLISSDSSNAVQAVTSTLKFRDPDNTFIAEISSLLKLSNFIGISHVKCTANCLGHCIAR